MIFEPVTHACRICGGVGAILPIHGPRDALHNRPVTGYHHTECRRRKNEETSRRHKAALAKRWAEAGQQSLPWTLPAPIKRRPGGQPPDCWFCDHGCVDNGNPICPKCDAHLADFAKWLRSLR